MTATDIINRINDGLQNGDQLDLYRLAMQVSNLLMSETERAAWLALIETASDTIDGAFR